MGKHSWRCIQKTTFFLHVWYIDKGAMHCTRLARLCERCWSSYIFLSCGFRLQFHDHFKNNIMGSVSVNVPQFSLPTVEDVSRVSMLNVRSAEAEESASHPHGKRKSIRLPDECRESGFLALYCLCNKECTFKCWRNRLISILETFRHQNSSC